MFAQSFDYIADVVLQRREVYPLEVESRIRELANRLSATAFMETIARLDDRDPKFAEALSDLCESLPKDGGYYTIGFGDGAAEGADDQVSSEEPVAGAVYYFRLMFANEDAAYYQFPLFPDFERDYILGGGRKRSKESQYIRLELSDARFLQTFIEECRRNPHFVRIEECSADEFRDAPSNAV